MSTVYLTVPTSSYELYVFENRVLRRVFGPKRDEVTGEWKKLHNEELSDMYQQKQDHPGPLRKLSTNLYDIHHC